MKKVFLLGIFYSFFICFAYSQKEGRYRISGLSEISFFNNKTLTSYGISVEYFIHKNFSLNYQYSFGINQQHNTYMHYTASIAGIAEIFRSDSYYLVSSSNEESWMYFILITFVIPEGISFHSYPRKWLEIAPFINPLSADFNILDNNRSTLTMSLGLKLYFKPVYNFSISPHFGLKHIYKNRDVGNFYGLSIGYLF
jgi:hypothetical protein